MLHPARVQRESGGSPAGMRSPPPLHRDLLQQHHPCPGRGCPDLPCTDIRCCFPKNVSESDVLDSRDAGCAVIFEDTAVPGRQSSPCLSPATAWATAGLPGLHCYPPLAPFVACSSGSGAWRIPMSHQSLWFPCWVSWDRWWCRVVVSTSRGAECLMLFLSVGTATVPFCLA